jgi:hypothetical protein
LLSKKSVHASLADFALKGIVALGADADPLVFDFPYVSATLENVRANLAAARGAKQSRKDKKTNKGDNPERRVDLPGTDNADDAQQYEPSQN